MVARTRFVSWIHNLFPIGNVQTHEGQNPVLGTRMLLSANKNYTFFLPNQTAMHFVR